jgi:vancomycin resistance protein YoaR
MSLSRTIKLAGFAAAFILPLSADGAELKFAEKIWEVKPETNVVTAYPLRNDFGLENLIKQSYSTSPFTLSAPGIDAGTVKILDEASAAINQETKPAKLVIEGMWAREFEPGQDGQALDVYKTYKLVAAGQPEIDLPVLVSQSGSNLSETNSLGINELVATGESDFSGSPYNRRVNIKVGASKFQGLIVKPGQEFSFNEILGDVDGEHGFLPELVIKKTGTVPEFGGGLCQVSSTAFRAAMNAGLPITARRNHSYAVKYYAPQGTDATIYPGVQDFKFLNDLSSHMLIRTRMEGDKLYYDFYGTKDDRKVTFDGPYQYDKRSNGAMKATWTRSVEKDGQKTEQVFNSTYQPPALFHTVAQASTPNPQTAGANITNPNSEDPNAAPSPTPAPEPEKENDSKPPTSPDDEEEENT